jgi:hypothetical protein
MTDKTPEQIKAEARKLRNKPPVKPSNPAVSSSDHFNTKGKSSGGSQTVIKPARKPSV